MNMILLGIGILFVCPIAIGAVLARLTEPLVGVIGGVVLFAVIVTRAYRNMMKIQNKGDHRNDKGGNHD